MGGVAGIVGPIFVIIMLGAAARQSRVIDFAGLRGITDLTFYLGLPALLFSSVIEAQAFSLLDVAALYFMACLAVFALGLGLARLLLGAGMAQATMVGLNSCFGNTGMLALPMIAAAFGADGVAVLLPIIALHSLLLLPLATMLIEADGQGTVHPWRLARAVAPSLVRNPILVAIMAAFAWRMLGLGVPVPLHRLLAMLAGAAPTMALFALGGTLPGMAARGSVREAGLATGLKLVLLPLLVW
jgi:malonate transporter